MSPPGTPKNPGNASTAEACRKLAKVIPAILIDGDDLPTLSSIVTLPVIEGDEMGLMYESDRGLD